MWDSLNSVKQKMTKGQEEKEASLRDKNALPSAPILAPFLRDPDLASIIHTEKVGHVYLKMDCPSDSLSFSNCQ